MALYCFQYRCRSLDDTALRVSIVETDDVEKAVEDFESKMGLGRKVTLVTLL
jgi:hypothetical protein